MYFSAISKHACKSKYSIYILAHARANRACKPIGIINIIVLGLSSKESKKRKVSDPNDCPVPLAVALGLKWRMRSSMSNAFCFTELCRTHYTD